jgi:ankyrin repeat protein
MRSFNLSLRWFRPASIPGFPLLVISLAGLLLWVAPRVQAAGGAKQSVAPANPAADAKLLLAIRRADLKLLKTAIAEGANPNIRGTSGLTPMLQLMHVAKGPLSKAQYDCFAFLLSHGANPGATDADRRPPLIQAARAGDLKTVRLLVEVGQVYVKARDRFHKTALLYAAEARRRDIVDYLASNGDLQSRTVRERREHHRR